MRKLIVGLVFLFGLGSFLGAQIETIKEIRVHPLDSTKLGISTIQIDTADNFYNIEYSEPYDSTEIEDILFGGIESKKIELIEYKRLIRNSEKAILQNEREVRKLVDTKYKAWIKTRDKANLKGDYELKMLTEKIAVKVNNNTVAREVVGSRRWTLEIDTKKSIFLKLDNEDIELILNQRGNNYKSIDNKYYLKKQ